MAGWTGGRAVCAGVCSWPGRAAYTGVACVRPEERAHNCRGERPHARRGAQAAHQLRMHEEVTRVSERYESIAQDAGCEVVKRPGEQVKPRREPQALEQAGAVSERPGHEWQALEQAGAAAKSGREPGAVEHAAAVVGLRTRSVVGAISVLLPKSEPTRPSLWVTE